MLDIKFVRDNPDAVKENIKKSKTPPPNTVVEFLSKPVPGK